MAAAVLCLSPEVDKGKRSTERSTGQLGSLTVTLSRHNVPVSVSRSGGLEQRVCQQC